MHPLKVFQHELLIRRVASRYLEARTYQEYVEDKKRRKEKPLNKKEWEARQNGGKKDDKGHGKDHGEGADKEHGKGHGEGHGHHEPGLTDALKRLSKKAVEFVKNAPSEVKEFCTNKESRAKTLAKADEMIAEAPEKFVKSAWEGIKSEAKEFKTAAEGISKFMTGGKVSEEESHAIKHVAIHAAVTVAVTALTGGGGAGFGAKVGSNFAHAVGKKVALNAVSKGLGGAVMAEECIHMAHGIGHHAGEFSEFLHHVVTAKDKKNKKDPKDLDPKALLTAFVTKAVQKEITQLKDEDLAAAIEEVSKENKS